MPDSPHEIYRCTTLGTSLVDALDELITNQALTDNLAVLVLRQFDRSMYALLGNSLKNKANIKVNGLLIII